MTCLRCDLSQLFRFRLRWTVKRKRRNRGSGKEMVEMAAAL